MERGGAPNAACLQCGSPAGTAGLIFCKECGAALRPPASLMPSDSQTPDSPARVSAVKPSIGAAAIFAVHFVVFFVLVHFDMLEKKGPLFQHPVAIGTSALVALLVATIGTVVTKLRLRNWR
jgi:hypothetical protein